MGNWVKVDWMMHFYLCDSVGVDLLYGGRWAFSFRTGRVLLILLLWRSHFAWFRGHSPWNTPISYYLETKTRRLHHFTQTKQTPQHTAQHVFSVQRSAMAISSSQLNWILSPSVGSNKKLGRSAAMITGFCCRNPVGEYMKLVM